MFDLDGTLVDSVPDLAVAVDEMLVEMGFSPVGEDKTKLWIGNGIPVLVRRALRDAGCSEEIVSFDSDAFTKARDAFDRAYDKSCGSFSVVYPGVRESLSKLHELGIKLAVITNKSERFTGGLLAHLEIDQYFSMVVCGDTLPERKPDPTPLIHVMDHFDVEPDCALMVGDSRHDVAAARAAGVACVAVPYGYNHGEPIMNSSPDGLVSTLAELVGE
ncbi:phosphoglycolate phosphatase [Sansalvadorimonas sp. 2012CJ34-2]|uniref:Phosphoglycolate phosphatase n=1 Tax=Parendozoicomonas callyspongiae TaxID=2942213 RepID=A0ABT0PKB1_9GAMM|nr:phosphoglycolate phosphatase [Sansalvadorimonas sp. 2012CJ34-2]MCL6271815.1 phosphoglycolate phosphatase [Sansalvadorimonas sp. 2012CJ34-2]